MKRGKIVYEKPRLIVIEDDILLAQGAVICKNGPSATSKCEAGTSAGSLCGPGSGVGV